MKRSDCQQSVPGKLPKGTPGIHGPVSEPCIVPQRPGILAMQETPAPEKTVTRPSPEYHLLPEPQPIPVKPRPEACGCFPPHPPRPMPPCPSPTPEPCVIDTSMKDINIVGVGEVSVKRKDDFLTRTFEVSVDMSKKADKTYVDSGLAKKADKTYVDSGLAKKADKDTDAVEGNLAVFDGNGNPVDSGAEITSAYDGSNSTDPVTGAAVSLAIADKADKVSDAISGNFAGLDASGNLTDSGSKASDFAISGHSHGNISNDGKVGSTADLSVVTTTGGEVTTVDLTTADVAASGTALTAVTKVTQDSKGKISVEKKTIQDGTTAQKGVVQLSSATDSDSETFAATSKAVKDVMDSVDGLSDDKADKVSNATAGNFAGLDSEGNLTDSGSKASDFKTKQTAVSDPTASGNAISFIDTIYQDTNGVITPTKKTVSLSSAVDSDAEDAAATPKAVKLAYEHADSVVANLDSEVESNDGTNVQVKVTQVAGEITAVNITTDNTVGRGEGTFTEGNIPAFDGDGNIIDSGLSIESSIQGIADADGTAFDITDNIACIPTAVEGSVIDPETKETLCGNLGLVTIATIEL